MNLDDLAPVEETVTYQGKTYAVREASSDAAAKWRNALSKSTKIQDGKLVGMDSIADCDPLLVSLCLYYADESGKVPLKDGAPDPTRLVGLPSVRALPERVVKRLHAWITERSDFGGTEAKNSQSATPGTST
jgi:hypothetical protein